MKLIIFALLSLSTFLFACSSQTAINTEPTPIQLQDVQKQWQLISIDNKVIETTSTLNISELTAKGNLACNHFFGTLELQQNKLRIDKMGSTRKMCAAKVNDLEMVVSSTLSDWSEVRINAEQLTLTGATHTLIYTIK